MREVQYLKISGDEVVLTPDINAVGQRAIEHHFYFVPDNIKVKYTNLAGQGVLAPQVIIGFPDLFIPLDGVVYEFLGLSQKYRNEAARQGISFTEYIQKNYSELTAYKYWSQVAGRNTDMLLEIWVW